MRICISRVPHVAERRYYVLVRAVNSVGLDVTAVSAGVTIDITPPDMGPVYVGPTAHANATAAYQTNNTAVRFAWRGVGEDISAVRSLEYAIGVFPGDGSIRSRGGVAGGVHPDGNALVSGVAIRDGALVCVRGADMRSRIGGYIGNCIREWGARGRNLRSRIGGCVRIHDCIREWGPRRYATLWATNSGGLSSTAASSGVLVDSSPPVIMGELGPVVPACVRAHARCAFPVWAPPLHTCIPYALRDAHAHLHFRSGPPARHLRIRPF